MELWLRKNQERKRNQLVSVLLANADGLGKSRILDLKNAFSSCASCRLRSCISCHSCTTMTGYAGSQQAAGCAGLGNKVAKITSQESIN